MSESGISLVIITGLSGAGKTQALRFLEDAGYHCADNLPFRLLPGFVEQCRGAVPAIDRAAVVIDSREAAFGADWMDLFSLLDKLDIQRRIIFLDCNNTILLRRYHETRRRHPLASGGDILAGIMRERALLQTLRDRANIVIDTSNYTPMQFSERMRREFSFSAEAALMVNFISFGYKRGVPMDADIVMDMRFLPNPFYAPALRPLSGRDEAVRSYLLAQEGATVFFNSMQKLLLHILPGYAQQGKQHVQIAFGCTGGRHRSVMAAEELAARLLGTPYNIRCTHRDIEEEAHNIETRFAPQEGEGGKELL